MSQLSRFYPKSIGYSKCTSLIQEVSVGFLTSPIPIKEFYYLLKMIIFSWEKT